MSKAVSDYDEGYVKYVSQWTAGPAPDRRVIASIDRWRRRLFAAGLIGHYADLNVGYGNLSVRIRGSDRFVISGTQTGHIEHTTAEHYAVVTGVDIAANTLSCIGPIQASSEAMTHAAIYSLSADIRAVVHAHSAELWRKYRDRLPTTAAAIAYGTPEMAGEFVRLWRSTRFADDGVAVMGGHAEGLVSVGSSIDEASRRMLALADIA